MEDNLKAAAAKSEVHEHSYMENSLAQDSKCNELLGFSGEQYAMDVNCFDNADHERSSLLDIMLDQEEEGTKRFEEEFNIFENFLQNKTGAQAVNAPPQEDPTSDPDEANQDGLGMKYLLKIDELPSEQSDGEPNTAKKRQKKHQK